MDTKQLFSVEGKVAVVTGGSRGIGAMIARGFVESGAKVYISSRKAEACKETAAELGAQCIPVPADLSTEDGIGKLAETLSSNEDHLDVLINNAGATWGAPMEEYPREAFDKIFNINVKAIHSTTMALLPLLRKAGEPENPARVINIGSIDGLRVPEMQNYAYSASKSAVHMLTRHLAQHLVAEHVSVNAIAPGLFPSNMTKFLFDNGDEAVSGFIPMKRPGRPEDIAGTAIFLSSRAGAYLTGAVIPVDGGVSTK